MVLNTIGTDLVDVVLEDLLLELCLMRVWLIDPTVAANHIVTRIDLSSLVRCLILFHYFLA